LHPPKIGAFCAFIYLYAEPTFCPYGTLENIGGVFFYPPFVPTGLWKISGIGVSTHIPSLRDFGKHRGWYFLPTFGPYGTLENTGLVFSTHIWSLRDFGKHRGWCFLPTFGPYGTLENTGLVFLPTFGPYGTTENIGAGVSTHIWSLRDSGKLKLPQIPFLRNPENSPSFSP